MKFFKIFSIALLLNIGLGASKLFGQSSLLQGSLFKSSTASQSASASSEEDSSTSSGTNLETLTSVTQESKSAVLLEFNFAAPEVETSETSSTNKVSFSQSENQVTSSQSAIPSFSYAIEGKILNAQITSRTYGKSIKNASFSTTSSETTTDRPLGLETENSESNESSSSYTTSSSTSSTKSDIEWHYSGKMRGTDISHLTISPYKYNSKTQSLSYTSAITVQLTLDKSSETDFQVGIDTKKLLQRTPSSRRHFSKSESVLGKNTASKSTAKTTTATSKSTFNSVFSTEIQSSVDILPVTPKYRLIIDEDGVYQIDYYDLIDEGFPSDFFTADPRTIRIFNKGDEIPIYVKGEEDGEFDRSDYIEFIGEANRIGLSDSDRPDMYYDPYTDENVYFLYWESTQTSSNSGLRLVDVPAQIQATIPLKSAFNLTGSSFRSSVHFEENNVTTERMSGFYSIFNQEEYETTRNHSDARDLDFWTSIYHGRASTFDIIIPYPDQSVSSDTAGLRVRAAFHGLSMVALSGEPQNTAVISLGTSSSTFEVTETSWGTNVYSNSNYSRQEKNVVDVKLDISKQRLLDADSADVVQISNTDDISTGSSSRVFYFNWLDITYRRLYRAYNDMLEFTTPPTRRPGTYHFQITDFTTSDIDIYKVGVGKLTNFIVESYVSSEEDETSADGEKYYRAIFQDAVVNPEDVTYIAVSSDQKKDPSRYEEVEPSNLFNQSNKLTDQSNSYDYIIITSDEFINSSNFEKTSNPVRQYKEYRESYLKAIGETGNVLVVTTQAVYDEFNYGIKSPHAIRDFLDYAYHEWAVAPTYVLLLGDASYSTSNDYVPTMHVQTLRFGATAADVWYAMVDGLDESGQLDLLPDMQISRVPARSLSDISAYLEKLENYELYITNSSEATIGTWRNTVVMIAGETGSESIGSSSVRKDAFVTQIDNLLADYVNRGYFVKRIHTNLGRNASSDITFTDIYRGTRSDLRTYLNDGCLILNFLGHGGGGVWSDSQVLTLDGVSDLSNYNTLPFVTSMTCFTGAFDEPQFNALGGTLTEELILAEQKGAIGVISSSGLGWLINDELMANALYEFLLNDKYQGLSITDMMFRAKVSYYLDNIYTWLQAPTMLYQYGVFGDPALRLSSPIVENSSSNYNINWSLETHLVEIGDTLKVTGTVDGITTGIGYGYLADSDNLDVSEDAATLFFIDDGKINAVSNGQLSDTLYISIEEPVQITSTNVSNFSGGLFKVYLQGSDEDEGKDLNGYVSFSSTGTYIHYVEPNQDISTAENTDVKFTAKVESKSTISSIGVLVTLSELDENFEYETISGWQNKFLTATFTSDNVYTTTNAIPGDLLQKGVKVTYSLFVKTATTSYSTSSVSAIVGELPDVAAYSEAKEGLLQFFDNTSIDFYTENNQVVLGATVYNWSGVDANNVIVKFYNDAITNGAPNQNTTPTLSSSAQPIGIDTVDISAESSTLATIPIPDSFVLSETYNIGIRVYVDTSSSYEDDYTNNLSNSNEVTYDLVYVSQSAGDSLKIDTDVTLVYEAAAFSKSGFLQITKVQNPTVTSQPDNEFVRLASQSGTDEDNTYAYTIATSDSNLTISKSIELILKFDMTDDVIDNSSSNAALVYGYFYSENYDRWLKASSQSKTDESTVNMEISEFGEYALMYSSDVSSPVVSLGVEGQYNGSKVFAPKQARIIATVQDQNGVYLDPDFITIILDDDSSDALTSKLTLPQSSSNANSVAVYFDEEFEVGTHEITFIFHDANLNETRSETMEVIVEDDFGLVVYGSFPNPFANDGTDIAYRITGTEGATSFEIKIYTVAGKLINTYSRQNRNTLSFNDDRIKITGDDPGTVGLHVINWNGTDGDGAEVANGVYFCKIKASFNGNAKEDIIKIVRLR
ncbi:hypothetical protein Ctha_2534 [Chloroherpeton thalassium ATCC 35110]|uniref:Gingipain domain-containing protein n=1 Tax=Chloroherpeton thalassium (strain ATCC 35110 / GB-78) TaxID=517418 RepID=B3QXR8_CHLT3|nr:C25 family cysteine peptidase [Chloroherpeton thalassium]ACF14983.1 hypothetical protein Ctha_2534 [Chloroherpeton thalassium ATCC 35110]